MFGFSFSYFTAAQLPIPPKNIMLQSVSNTINPRKTSDKGHDPYTSATTSLMYVCISRIV